MYIACIYIYNIYIFYIYIYIYTYNIVQCIVFQKKYNYRKNLLEKIK